jgi:hypothetical protein
MDRSGRQGALFTLLGLFALGAVVAVVPALRDAVGNVLSGDAGELRQELRDLGPAGALVLLALMLVHAVLPFPSELVNAAAGFVYGFWIAFPLALFGWLLSALATYAIGRTAARPALQRFVGEERIEEGARIVERGGTLRGSPPGWCRSCPTAPSATWQAPRGCRSGASRGRRSSARRRCARRSSIWGTGSTRCRRPTPGCSSRSPRSCSCWWAAGP